MTINSHLTLLLHHYTSVQSRHNSGTYTVGRIFLLPDDINLCPVLPFVLSQLFPIREVFKFLAAKT
jgi:hypothetical protein